MPQEDADKVFGMASGAVCACTVSASNLICSADPEFWAAVEHSFPERKPESRVHAVVAGFASLAYSLMRAESLFELVRQQIRELYTMPPEPLGDISGPSYHDMGLRFAESVFTRLQVAADFNSIWATPIRGATEEHIARRARDLGQRAEAVLPAFWRSAPRCDSQRLRDCIETEAARAVKAWRLKTQGK
jgi:hypothetical protein